MHNVILDATVDTGMMDKILGAAESVITFSGNCLSAMVENPLYLFYLATGIVTVGLALVTKLRRTAR